MRWTNSWICICFILSFHQTFTQEPVFNFHFSLPCRGLELHQQFSHSCPLLSRTNSHSHIWRCLAFHRRQELFVKDQENINVVRRAVEKPGKSRFALLTLTVWLFEARKDYLWGLNARVLLHLPDPLPLSHYTVDCITSGHSGLSCQGYTGFCDHLNTSQSLW